VPVLLFLGLLIDTNIDGAKARKRRRGGKYFFEKMEVASIGPSEEEKPCTNPEVDVRIR
jgi:hypothetical protein